MKSLREVHPMKWIIYALSILFYFYEFFVRVTPGVMLSELMRDFSIDASELGTMVAFYFYAIVPMQIVAGLLMDRYGARRLLALATLVCAAGELLFAGTSSVVVASFARAIMGAASAFGFVGMVYIVSHWFPKPRRTLLVGLANSMGTLGPFFGLGPMRTFVEASSWRFASYSVGIAGCILALLIFLVVRNESQEMKSHHDTPPSFKDVMTNFKIVFKNFQTWVAGLSCLFSYASTIAFAGLWGTHFLEVTHGMTEKVAGYAASMMFIGSIIGSPIIGKFDHKVGRRRPIMIICSLIGALAVAAIIYIEEMPISVIFALILLSGIMASAHIVTFSQAVDVNPDKAKGSAIAVTNTFLLVGGAILQPAVGVILDMGLKGDLTEAPPIFTLQDFHRAFIIFPITFLLAALISFFIKECSKHKELGFNEPPC